MGDIHTPQPPHANVDISVGQDHWIKLNDEKALWLLVESLSSCFKVNGNTLAIGHVSGRISFVGFCI